MSPTRSVDPTPVDVDSAAHPAVDDNCDTDEPSLGASDPAARRLRHLILTKLAKDDSQPVLAEMANEILAGRLTPWQAVSSSAYSEQRRESAEARVAGYSELSIEEKEQALQAGRAEYERIAAGEEPDLEGTTASEDDSATHDDEGHEDEPPGSVALRW